LIAAIRAELDSDAPRLVYADFLEDRGDPQSVARAEFIRIQVQRSNLPPEDERHSPLMARAPRLLAAPPCARQGAHFCFRKGRFRRGFIEYVHLDARHFLHHRRQLVRLEPLRDISLTGLRIGNGIGKRLAGCPELSAVETLRIYEHHSPIPLSE